MPKDKMRPYIIGSPVWNGLSKLIEEAGEVIQVGGKIMGTGGDVIHWDGPPLDDRMEEELGDLLAAIEFFTDNSTLSWAEINKRRVVKLTLFRQWDEDANSQ